MGFFFWYVADNMSNDEQPTLPVKADAPEPEAVKKDTTSVDHQGWSTEMIACGLGILFFFLMYGVIQERIMTRPWEEGGPLFTYSAYLVLSNRLIALATAASILLYTGQSLKNVSFPTQTLGKCGKTIPVLILGTLISGKRYKVSDYVICVLITLGCTIFLLTGDISSPSDRDDSIYGLF